MSTGRYYLLLGGVVVALLSAPLWKPAAKPTIVELPAGQKFVASGFVGHDEHRFLYTYRPMIETDQPESHTCRNSFGKEVLFVESAAK